MDETQQINAISKIHIAGTRLLDLLCVVHDLFCARSGSRVLYNITSFVARNYSFLHIRYGLLSLGVQIEHKHNMDVTVTMYSLIHRPSFSVFFVSRQVFCYVGKQKRNWRSKKEGLPAELCDPLLT